MGKEETLAILKAVAQTGDNISMDCRDEAASYSVEQPQLRVQQEVVEGGISLITIYSVDENHEEPIFEIASDEDGYQEFAAILDKWDCIADSEY